ncbi:hypothetical protein [Nitrosomonas halophila]|uniref:Uncharacterized protein n=1 Tax=Nitrosomonas halophila TaxID=44576 RepID=A0A1H3KF59_9PROT|nr:hypothetical protein [Nitrosomonas halophila]SDY50777.1 hypothetical protein SAMN05421881_10403 [Nitrosomonas halophila]
MTNFEFMKEEYLSLRREIEASISELATLERQCVLATAGIYNKHAKGWEHFHYQATRNKFRTKVRVAAWLTLIALTIFIAFHGSTIVAEPKCHSENNLCR